MRRVLILLTILLIANLAAPVVQAWGPQRDGPGLFTGGGGVPFVVDPQWFTRTMQADHHVVNGAAGMIARALQRGAPIVCKLTGRMARVYWSPEAERYIVLLDDGTGQRVWKFVYMVDSRSRSLRLVTNFYMHERRALARAIARIIAEGAYRVAPPYRVGGAP